MRRLALAASACALLAAAPARAAQDKPFQLSLLAPVQVFPERESISGVRLSLLYGKNANFTGLDLALVAAHATGNFSGVQWALVGLVDRDMTGWQGSFVNVTGGKMNGLQWGLFNRAKRVEGLQLGLVNQADTIHGIQIGLVNLIAQGGWFPVMVLVNGSL
jgi:opacity protein-like surface antigen